MLAIVVMRLPNVLKYNAFLRAKEICWNRWLQLIWGQGGGTLCLDAPSRPWLDMSFGIVSPFRGWSATDAQGTNC